MPHRKIGSWDYPAPDVVLGILWMAQLAYPEQFKAADNDLMKEEHPSMPINIDRQSRVTFGGSKKS